MAHTKEEDDAAEDFGRNGGTHAVGNEYGCRKLGFLAGVGWQKQQSITCPSCGEKIRFGLSDELMEKIKNSKLLKK